jgi:hypothetical protein
MAGYEVHGAFSDNLFYYILTLISPHCGWLAVNRVIPNCIRYLHNLTFATILFTLVRLQILYTGGHISQFPITGHLFESQEMEMSQKNNQLKKAIQSTRLAEICECEINIFKFEMSQILFICLP